MRCESTMSTLVSVLACSLSACDALTQPGKQAADTAMVGAVPYEKLGARSVTERAIIDALFPTKV